MSNKVPQIRFNGYSDAWEQRKFGELYKKNLERNKDHFSSGRTISIATMRFKKEGNGAAENSLVSYKVLREGDIAFEGHTSKRFAFGRFVLNDIGDGIMSPRFTTLRPTQDMPIKFWKQYIHYEPIMRYPIVNSTKLGTMMNELVVDEFLNQPVLVPELSEQEKIGSFFQQLDETIALHQRKLDLLKEQKKGYLQKMFPKNGAKVPELRFAGFADAWEERKLTDLATTYIGLVTTMTENYTTEGTLLIRNSDIKEGRFDLSNPIYLEEQFAEKNKTRRMKKGDVVTVHTGDIGTSAIINSELDGTIGFATITTRPKKELDSNFLAWYFNSNYHKKYAKRMSTGDGRSNYNMKDFNKNVIPTPKIAEQQKIGSFFKQLDETLALHQRELDLLKEQKKGYLQKMFC